jgi:hypothetical protein
MTLGAIFYPVSSSLTSMIIVVIFLTGIHVADPMQVAEPVDFWYDEINNRTRRQSF